MPDNSARPLFLRLVDWADRFINLVCVSMLLVQVGATIVMVFGRYFFHRVPRGTEELALFCMVWFSLISLSLSVRDDTHIKMEVADIVFKKESVLRWFRLFASAVTLAFSGFMVYYGAGLVKLTAGTRMAGIGISQGWLYMPIPVGGVFMAVACVAQIFETVWRMRDD